jgi:hypothetical protein
MDYLPRNWEFGSALSKLRNFGVGGWTPASVLHWFTLYRCSFLSFYKLKLHASSGVGLDHQNVINYVSRHGHTIAERDSNLKFIILDLWNRSCYNRPTPYTNQCRVTSCAVPRCMTWQTSRIPTNGSWLNRTNTLAEGFFALKWTHEVAQVCFTDYAVSPANASMEHDACLRGGPNSLRRWGWGQCSSETLVLPTRLHGIIQSQQVNQYSPQNLRPNMGLVRT